MNPGATTILDKINPIVKIAVSANVHFPVTICKNNVLSIFFIFSPYFYFRSVFFVCIHIHSP